MRFVFDIDDTISRHQDRDYANAEPLWDAIVHMRELKETMPDAEIVLYTARGMNSCAGDAAEARRRNEGTLVEWLKEHGVPYDEIVWGKVLADAYIDDKAVSAGTFAMLGAGPMMNGYSGAKVTRIGDMVIKESKDAEAQARWYREARRMGLRVPRVRSSQLGKLYLDYVEGDSLDIFLAGQKSRHRETAVGNIVRMIRTFSSYAALDTQCNDTQEYARLVRERGLKAEVDTMALEDAICALKGGILRPTWCHGDMTMQNIIVTQDQRIVLIDPSQKPYFSTWLLDIGKLKASLAGLDQCITGAAFVFPELVEVVDALLTPAEREASNILCASHIVRVMPFARERNDRYAEEGLRKLYAKVCEWL